MIHPERRRENLKKIEACKSGEMKMSESSALVIIPKLDNMPSDKIEYKSHNGYTGVLYGKSSMSIYGPSGTEVLHTGSRNVNSLEELKKLVDNTPDFMEMLMVRANQESAENVTDLYCDDITFCWGPCDRFKCPRNRYNIRDKRVPHSFFAEGVVPDDCPKQKVKENR